MICINFCFVQMATIFWNTVRNTFPSFIGHGIIENGVRRNFVKFLHEVTTSINHYTHLILMKFKGTVLLLRRSFFALNSEPVEFRNW